MDSIQTYLGTSLVKRTYPICCVSVGRAKISLVMIVAIVNLYLTRQYKSMYIGKVSGLNIKHPTSKSKLLITQDFSLLINISMKHCSELVVRLYSVVLMVFGCGRTKLLDLR